MKPLEYLEFKKTDIFLELTAGDYHSTDEANEIYRLLIEYTNEFSSARKSEQLTKGILSKIDKLDNDVRSIKHYLVKALEKDDTFVYAYNPLAQVAKKNSLFEYPLKMISEVKLHDLLEQEELENSEELKRTYIIENNQTMKDIFEICQSAFDCDYLTFREGIEAANFKKMIIIRQNFVQDLTYRLSSIMEEGWYTDVCNNMKWEKSTCSGQKKKLEDDFLTKKLDKKLPRPQKRKTIQ